MEDRIYFKHSLITSGKQDEVEDEINVFNNEHTTILGVTVTPFKIGETFIDGIAWPKYGYHVCITYKSK